VRPARKRRPCSTPRAVSHLGGAAKDYSPRTAALSRTCKRSVACILWFWKCRDKGR
jgi:hypothetical protein